MPNNSDFAKSGDIAAHKQESYKHAHGIWAKIKDYCDTMPCYIRMIDADELSVTEDAGDHDYDFTALTSAATVAVILEVRQSSSGTAGRWVKVKTKAKGEATWDHDGGLEITDSASGVCRIPRWGEQFIQRTDSGQEVTYNIDQEGVTKIFLVGYVEQGKF